MFLGGRSKLRSFDSYISFLIKYKVNKNRLIIIQSWVVISYYFACNYIVDQRNDTIVTARKHLDWPCHSTQTKCPSEEMCQLGKGLQYPMLQLWAFQMRTSLSVSMIVHNSQVCTYKENSFSRKLSTKHSKSNTIEKNILEQPHINHCSEHVGLPHKEGIILVKFVAIVDANNFKIVHPYV